MLCPNKLGGSMAKNKKPTMMQVKNVVNNVITQLIVAQKGINELDYLLNSFIEFNGDVEGFKKFLDKKIEEDKAKEHQTLAEEQDHEDNEKWQQKQDKEAK
jgi:hypothetical protein